jgi:1,4-dihydroxy-2-naphthoate octaprenyltransferase
LTIMTNTSGHAVAEPAASYRAGLWRLSDPKISTASMASMLLGALFAARDGPLHAGWLTMTVLGIFFIEVAKNASGELFDYDSGADLGVAPEDRSPFSGGKRVLVDRLLTRAQTRAIALAGYVLGAAAGIIIAAEREPRVLGLGILGIGCAFFYHASPVRLSYRGFGELAVAFCYGPLIACGTYLVQRGRISAGIILAAVPLGLLIAAFLWINEFPDYRADRAAGKRTWVVRLGRRRAAVSFAVLIAAALAFQAALPLFMFRGGRVAPFAVWLGLISAIPGAAAARRLIAYPDITARVIPAQRNTLLAFVLLALGSGIGALLG